MLGERIKSLKTDFKTEEEERVRWNIGIGQFHFERHNVFPGSEIPAGDGEAVPRVFFRLSFYPVVQPTRLRTPERRRRAICVIGSAEITRGTLMQMRSKWKLGRNSAALSRL